VAKKVNSMGEEADAPIKYNDMLAKEFGILQNFYKSNGDPFRAKSYAAAANNIKKNPEDILSVADVPKLKLSEKLSKKAVELI
jgi:hypothetical protein